MLRVGDREIWRERAFFEDYKRFPEVVDLLMARYGTRLKDVVPTGAASFFRWGDSLAAGAVIKETPARVHAAADPPPPKSAAEREREHREFEARRARAVAERELGEPRRRAQPARPEGPAPPAAPRPPNGDRLPLPGTRTPDAVIDAEG